jgi:23S rRNA (pseudouridine1915-N3)-methyltransferase
VKIEFLVVGKTQVSFVKAGEQEYSKRLKHYIPVNYKVIPDVKKGKGRSQEELKKKEGEAILASIQPADILVLLDEGGMEMSSVKFSKFINDKLIHGVKRLVFVVGGAYGFSDEVYKRSQFKLSLSQMTFSHQMVRMIFLEQLYRAFTIIRGEPYHHE